VLQRGINYDEWLAEATVNDVLARRVNMLDRCWAMDGVVYADGIRRQCVEAVCNANGTCSHHETSERDTESCFAASEQEAGSNPELLRDAFKHRPNIPNFEQRF
jgi:hypothetical protein